MLIMQLFIKPLDLHHYDVYLLKNNLFKFGNSEEKKKYLGSATISLDGNKLDLYCEDNRMKNYSEIIGKQAYSYYSNNI